MTQANVQDEGHGYHCMPRGRALGYTAILAEELGLPAVQIPTIETGVMAEKESAG